MAAGQVPQADTGPRDLALAPEPCRRYAPRMTDSMRITILLASFQGERFIGAQLDSLARQDHRNWRLILSDDGSTDGTLEIVRRFAAAHPSREIEIRQGPRRGATRNFLSMIELVEPGEALAFCDQDDLWLPDRLSRGVAALAQPLSLPTTKGIGQSTYCRPLQYPLS